MYHYFNDDQVTFRYIDLKPFLENLEPLESPNNCSKTLGLSQ